MSSFFRNPKRYFLVFSSSIFISLCFCSLFSNAENTISLGQSLTDGQTLISSDQSFEMGFFSPDNSTSRYVGIWYNISTKSVVWIANRDNPISDQKGVFKIAGDGTLVVLDGTGNSVWSSNVSSSSSSNFTAVLMDNGNFIVSSSGKTHWESFHHPTDTYLPGMRVLVNSKLGENRVFRSWKSITDPSTGKYTMGIDPRGSPQIVLWEGSSSIRRWRSGQWNGLIFIGIQNMPSNYLYGFKLSIDDGNGNTYFTYLPNNNAHILKFRVSWEGYEEQMKWNETKKAWDMMQYQPENECDSYNKCGNFSVCTPNNALTCSCIDGFVARDLNQWSKGNWSGGCVRRTKLQCQSNSTESDGFKEVKGVKLPDFSDSGMTTNTEDCKAKCLDECECKAYAYEPSIGCMIWREDLADIQQFSQNGRTLHVRLAHSELGGSSGLSGPVIAAIVVSLTVCIIVMIWLIWHYRTNLKACSNSCRKSMDLPMHDISKSQEFSTDFSGPGDVVVEGKAGKAPELPIYTLQCISTATNNFANANRLGQGGFGPVFKGKFPGGQEIAVKRLSRRSGQGADEFKNEIILIAKLQHRNLVRLLGCCIEGEEKMLIYEYMPNKSLDCFLFDTAKQAELDWAKRFSIIEGIARGLLYLHRDSRLRIIHRDLKASNILLDEDMIPKISDFGMARIFGGNQNEEANTNRVVGTYGYMSPEYAMEGLFSVKSDVYSFGVLLLEVISGRRNTSFRETESSNLIRHAWNLWNEGKATELIDATIVKSCSKNEVLRCIHVGMLCVQDSAAYRPTMSTVLLMLESENASMPIPKQPHTTGSMRSSSVDTADMWHEGQDMVSSSEITVSVVTGR